jgi:hypothetical protein
MQRIISNIVPQSFYLIDIFDVKMITESEREKEREKEKEG